MFQYKAVWIFASTTPIDVSEKLEAVAGVLPVGLRRGRFKAPDALIASLSLFSLQILLASGLLESVHVTVVHPPTGVPMNAHQPSHQTIACPTCGIYQAVEVDYDGGQGHASVPVTPCSVCHQNLCAFCDQLRCQCGQIVCPNCIVTVPDGTPAGLKLCQPCARQSDPLCPACGEFAPMIPRENLERGCPGTIATHWFGSPRPRPRNMMSAAWSETIVSG